MTEQRCSHGFLRSVVPCPACDPRLTERVALAAAEPSRAVARPRGHGEPHALVGAYRCRGRCGQVKPLSEFYISRTSKRGHQRMCKACDNNKRVGRARSATYG